MSRLREEDITVELIEQLAEVAGVSVEPERQEALRARYLSFLEDMERLQKLDIGDEEPATVFLAGGNEP